MRIAGSTKVIGYVGSTYATSRVYDLYNEVFPRLGLDFVYVPFAVDDAGQAVRAMQALGIHAIGVTIPFKVAIVPHLDEVDERVRRTGAVNVVRNEGGRLVGSNTDGLGALRALEEAVDPRGRDVLLIGGGGASRAIAAELTQAGAHVRVVGIIEAEAQIVASDIGCTTARWDDLHHHAARADIVINATPIGTAGTAMADTAPVPAGLLRPEQVVMDIVTTLPATRFIREAAARGCRTVGGERMLLWQALLKFEIFTGQPVPVEMMEAALRAQPAATVPAPGGRARTAALNGAPGNGG